MKIKDAILKEKDFLQKGFFQSLFNIIDFKNLEESQLRLEKELYQTTYKQKIHKLLSYNKDADIANIYNNFLSILDKSKLDINRQDVKLILELDNKVLLAISCHALTAVLFKDKVIKRNGLAAKIKHLFHSYAMSERLVITEILTYTLINLLIGCLIDSGMMKQYELKKEIYFEIYNPVLLEHLFCFDLINHIKLPMLCPPKDWKFESEALYYYGGYLNSHELNNAFLGLIPNLNYQPLIRLTQGYLDAINYLQSMGFKISHKKYDKFLNRDVKILNFDIVKYVRKWETCTIEEKVIGQEFFRCLQIIQFALENDCTLYFPYFLDARGRIYQHGYPLSFYCSKQLRELFVNSSNEEMLGFDACASAFQIQSGLVQCEKLLNLTNIISSENFDIYTNIMNMTKEVFYKNKTKNYEKRIEVTLLKLFEDRTFWKLVIMPYSYNEGSFNRFKRIREYIGNQEIAGNLTKAFEQVFKKEFNEIEHLKKICRYLGELNKEIVFASDFHVCIQRYCQARVIRFWRTDPISKIKRSYKFLEWDTNLPDKVKSRLSTLPNYIQFLDACILINILLDCKKENIKIWTIHDSFFVTKQNKTKILRIYKKAYSAVVLKPNLFLDFIRINLKQFETLNFEEKSKTVKTIKNIKKYLDLLNLNDDFLLKIFNKILQAKYPLKHK